MSNQAADTRTTIIPCLRYRNAAAAIDWLCEAFGFQEQAVHLHDDGSVAHAQLTFGQGMIMLGSVGPQPTEWGKWIKQPDQIGGAQTQAPYVVVSNPDVLYQRAKAAGAVIVIDIRDEDYGGRGFSCHDPEGHLWSFGSYDPWAG